MEIAGQVVVGANVAKQTVGAVTDASSAIGKSIHGLIGCDDDIKPNGEAINDDMKAPFWVIYRSNTWGSGRNGADGLVAEESFNGDTKDKALLKAVTAFVNRKGHKHAYGVADNNGRIYVYNASYTSSFTKQNCAKAIRQYQA